MEQVSKDVKNIVNEWLEEGYLKENDIFVIGCSTSEVAGEQIGTSGSEQIAAELFSGLEILKKEANIHLAFQCCEHLNRALVVERETMKAFNLDQVTVIPSPSAGGSMVTHAYEAMEDAVVVETIKADAGIDIGDTMIGMHLKPVAVPLRFQQKTIGQAHVTLARTRPKLIGGNRAKYPNT
ncbi:MAG TPA: TIGR01440 family protein [Bacillota bacterium]|nr:TIGR01440 family protein [Bacillota bacterium]